MAGGKAEEGDKSSEHWRERKRCMQGRDEPVYRKASKYISRGQTLTFAHKMCPHKTEAKCLGTEAFT